MVSRRFRGAPFPGPNGQQWFITRDDEIVVAEDRMSVNYIHTIKDEALWATQKQLWTALANGGIDPDLLNLDDLAAQVEVSKLREIADERSIFYSSLEWHLTRNGEVEVYFHDLMTDADAMCLKMALT